MDKENQLFPMDNEQNDMIIYRSKDGKVNVALMTRDGKVWLNQMQIAKLFGTSKQTISHHIANILKEKELDTDSVVKYYLTTAADGHNYKVIYYSLEMILAIGYRVRGVRGVQFRQWATQHLSEYLVKGFTMDDERLKNRKRLESKAPLYFRACVLLMSIMNIPLACDNLSSHTRG